MSNPLISSESSFLAGIFNRRMLICVFTGFSSGLPLYVLIQLIQAWFRQEGVSLGDIGLFALVTLPYNWKFVWAPLLDGYVPPFLGRRRGWMLITQIALLILIASFGLFDPRISLATISIIALAVAFFSATQDIVVDAYRRELLPDAELGLGNSIHVQAYRISGLVPGALGLVLADHLPWSSVFLIVGAFMLVGILLTLCIDELAVDEPATPRTLRAVVLDPYKEFIGRSGWLSAITIILFMFLYKLGDNMATALSTSFYIDLGFSMSQIGLIAKNAALWPSIIGGIAGGIWMIRLGINRALWIFGAVQLVTILGFAVLAEAGNDPVILAVVISMEYLGVGLGTAAFTAFIARATSPLFAATQFALFTAMATVPRTVASAVTGFIVEQTGWTVFFLLCAVIAIPGMLMLVVVAPWNGGDRFKSDLGDRFKSVP